ncbi:MAG: hypothetical protein DMG78_32420 [Acidobacteria bacterium]|nr:MAG: hypothetical protein DMG78_32420 [Acidobacteriota bacterium]
MTPREDKERSGKETAPPKLPETNPPSFPGSDYSFTLQAVFEMQGTLGKLTQAVENLTVSKVIYAAGAVLTVLGIIGGWLIGKIWELLIPYLQAHKP